jgi:hypothetical protein
MRRIMWLGMVGIMAFTLSGAWALAQDSSGQEPPATLVEKHQKLVEAIQKAQKEGKDLSPVARLMDEFGPLMKESKFKEAEALLDRALKAVDEAKPSPLQPPASLVEKHQKLEQAVRAAQKEKKDLTGAMKILQELDPLVKNQKFKEAEALIDRALKSLEEAKPGSDPTTRLQAKVEKIAAGVQKWQEDRRDPSPIGQLMEQVDPLMKAGKIQEAEAILDQALKELQSEKKD